MAVREAVHPGRGVAEKPRAGLVDHRPAPFLECRTQYCDTTFGGAWITSGTVRDLRFQAEAYGWTSYALANGGGRYDFCPEHS